MTQNEFDTTVNIILNGQAADAGDAACLLSDQSSLENLPSLIALTDHENLFLAEMAACAIANVAGASSMSCILQTLKRCTDSGMDSDSLAAAILDINPEGALNALKPLVLQRNCPFRLEAIWAISHVDQADARQILQDIIQDSSEPSDVRKQAVYYFDPG